MKGEVLSIIRKKPLYTLWKDGNLTVKETQRLMGYLGYGLSKHIKRDYIIMRCLEKGKKTMEVNIILDKCGLRLLGPNE